ncbi:hypothetical protein RF11_16131 [Thelohanellus kitauei]|uniref:Uncharacterized protein n=1 Tax=Thelohanellus kitauei TaxID=669202 RepID=A0A0C2JRJ9_THEKT|nr:hypothetical protein RF11_16131 [Thelohanellus kitauei]
MNEFIHYILGMDGVNDQIGGYYIKLPIGPFSANITEERMYWSFRWGMNKIEPQEGRIFEKSHVLDHQTVLFHQELDYWGNDENDHRDAHSGRNQFVLKFQGTVLPELKSYMNFAKS